MGRGQPVQRELSGRVRLLAGGGAIYTRAHADRYRHEDGDPYRHPNGDAAAYFNLHQHADADGHRLAAAYSHQHAHAHPHADADGHGHLDAPTPPGDSYEPDDTCAQAYSVLPNGLTRTHTFHIPGDQDWVKFTAPAKRTYILEVSNTGPYADPVALVYNTCSTTQPPLGGEDNPFGPSLRLEWDGTAGVTYYLKLMQHDPSVAGAGTNYDVTISEDVAQPEAPAFPRCAAKSSTTLTLQWDQAPEWDVVGYEVHYQQQGGGQSGAPPVFGQGNTYIEIASLNTGSWYDLWVKAIDYSNNRSDDSAKVSCRVLAPTDTSIPLLDLQAPVPSGTYSTRTQ